MFIDIGEYFKRLECEQLISDIGEYIEASFSPPGFDSWSGGLLNSLRILSATARIKNNNLYNATLAFIKKRANEFEFDLYNHL